MALSVLLTLFLVRAVLLKKMTKKHISETKYSPQNTAFEHQKKLTNSVGTAGFVLAIISLFLGWVPILGWVLWVLGMSLSLVGVFIIPRSLAIAGLIISLMGIILMLIVFAGVGAAVVLK